MAKKKPWKIIKEFYQFFYTGSEQNVGIFRKIRPDFHPDQKLKFPSDPTRPESRLFLGSSSLLELHFPCTSCRKFYFILGTWNEKKNIFGYFFLNRVQINPKFQQYMIEITKILDSKKIYFREVHCI